MTIMKRYAIFVLLFLVNCAVYATYTKCYDINLKCEMLKGNTMYESIYIKSIELSEDGKYFLVNENDNKILLENNFGKLVYIKYNTVEELWKATILKMVIPEILVKHGLQLELRKEMELDAIDYIQTIKKNNLEIKDPLLENYIYSLVKKILPKELVDGRTTDINIVITKDDSRNVAIFPNGTMVIDAGMLSMIKTEEELVAVLAHEIAHYVLDHNVDNVNKAITRKKRAEFWAALATGLTAVGEVALAAKNTNYIPGMATISMAALSSAVGNAVVDRLGMKYNHEQESEADDMSREVLRLLGYDSNAMSKVIKRLMDVCRREGIRNDLYESYTHPSLMERINAGGKVTLSYDNEFESMMSLPIKSMAEVKYVNKHFREAIAIVDININNKVAIPEDYIIKINSSLALYNEQGEDLLKMAEEARGLYPESMSLMESEIKVHIYMKNYVKALSLIDEYEKQLRLIMSDISNEIQWIRAVRRRCEKNIPK